MSEPRAKPRFAPRKKSAAKAAEEPSAASAAEAAAAVAQPSAATSVGARLVGDSSSSSRQGSGHGERNSGGVRGRGGRPADVGRDKNNKDAGRGHKSNIANLSGKAFFSGNSGTVTLKGPASGRTHAGASSGQGGVGAGAGPGFTVGRLGISVKLERGASGSLLGSEQVEDVCADDVVGQHASELYDGDDFGRKGRRSKVGMGLKGEGGVFQFNIPAEDASSESDGEGVGAAALEDIVVPFREQAPFSLKASATPKVEVEGACAPLLSSSTDEEVLKKEQDDSIFLLQMPSSLPLSRVVSHDPLASGTAANPQDPEAPAPTPTPAPQPGKIGKLQIMSSGKLFMVLDNGSRYEVHEGLVATFSQHLASVTTQRPGVKSEPSDGVKTEIVPEVFNDGSTNGTLHTIGNITRKWVVTPAIDEE